MDISEHARIQTRGDAHAQSDAHRLDGGAAALRDAIVESLGEKSLLGWAEVIGLLQEHGLTGRWRSLREFGLRTSG